MRRYLPVILIGLLLVLSVSSAFADENTLRLESVVVEAFDSPGDATFDDGTPIVWQVFGSKFATDDFPRMEYAPETWPMDLFGPYPENPAELQALGVWAKFDRQGYNQIEIVPGAGDGESWEAQGIPLPGRVQTIDFWAWGAQYDYTIEFFFMDYEGQQYRLIPIRKEAPQYPGSLNFVGWKNMYIDIPGHIRQHFKYKPSHQKMYLTKIVIYTHPEERVDNYYFYLDHLKVLTDFQESFFDGNDLTAPERIDEIWGASEE